MTANYGTDRFNVSFIHYFSAAREWVLDSVLFKETVDVNSQVRCHPLSLYSILVLSVYGTIKWFLMNTSPSCISSSLQLLNSPGIDSSVSTITVSSICAGAYGKCVVRL